MYISQKRKQTEMIHNSKSDPSVSRAEGYWQVSQIFCQASLEHNWEAYQKVVTSLTEAKRKSL